MFWTKPKQKEPETLTETFKKLDDLTRKLYEENQKQIEAYRKERK